MKAIGVDFKVFAEIPGELPNWVWVAAFIGFTASCSAGVQSTDQGIRPLEVSIADSVDSRDEIMLEAQTVLPTPAQSDSAADEAALDALRELEFASLTKGGEHVRGVVVSIDTLEQLHMAPRGGAASVIVPLDIESFASHRRVRYYQDYFLGPARERFTIWLGRMQRYEGMILSHFRRHGLPEDMMYLGLIESGYSNTAVSRASAVGMWQFIASTGRMYGLRVDDWVDERRDPFKATDAAARHLADLKEQFGSWYLAAAAYNGGATRVSRGLRRLNTTEPSDQSFFDLSDKRYIRPETRDYVPKLIAATRIAKDPALHGFGEVSGLTPLEFDEITVPGQTGLDVIADLADTSTSAIVELNPHFYRGATPPNEKAVVRVPRGEGPTVLSRYEELPSSERVNFLEHKVQRGETLGGIARTYRVGVPDLVAANPGVQPRRLRVGQRLTVPISRLARQGSGGRVTATSVPSSGRHQVRSGESLWVISQRYGVRVQDLRTWNGMSVSDSVLRVGQRLWVTNPSNGEG